MSDARAYLRALLEAVPGDQPAVPRVWLVELLEILETPATLAAVSTPANGGAPDEPLLTVHEVANRFGVTTDWLYRHWKVVGGLKLGRKVLRFPASALPRYLAARRKAS